MLPVPYFSMLTPGSTAPTPSALAQHEVPTVQILPQAAISAQHRARPVQTLPPASAHSQYTALHHSALSAATLAQFLHHRDLAISPTPESPLLGTDLSPEPSAPYLQLAPAPSHLSSEEEEDVDGVFSPRSSSPVKTSVTGGHLRSHSSYTREFPLWYGHPWMGPPIPFPGQWPCWNPWESYKRHSSTHPTSRREDHRSPSPTTNNDAELQDEPTASPAENVAPDTSPTNKHSSVLPEEAIMPLPLTADNFTHFQDLFKRVADQLKINLEEVSEHQYELTDILQLTASSKIALSINGAIMEPAKTIWQTLATISPTRRRADCK